MIRNITIDNVLREKWDDDSTPRQVTYYDATGALVPSTTDKPNPRPYTAAENAAADAAAQSGASLTDHERRIRLLEAAVFPTPTTPPTGPTDPTVKTFTQWGGIVPAGAYVLDGGAVYQNATTTPLTTAPTAMPGGPGAWGHPWKPPTPPPTGNAWVTGKAYKVGDTATYGGKTYTCIGAHTSQATWQPPNAPSLWQVKP